MGKFFTQYKAILYRNIKMNLQKKQYIRENVAVLILSVFILFAEISSSNNLMTPFYLAVAIMSYTRVVTLVWITQKETHQKQLQKIMGVSQEAYYLSWLTYFLINGFFVSFSTMFLFNLFVVQIGGVNITYSDGYSFIHIIILYFVFCISTIGLTIFLCTFFSKAKTAAQGITFIQLLLNFLFFLRFSGDFSNSKLYVALASISPQACFNFGITSIAFINKNTPKTILTYQECLLEMFLTGIFFLLFGLYLDQVWPNQMGTNKSPLFFLQFAKKKNVSNSEVRLIDEEQFETSAKYQQHVKNHKKQTIKMSHISKKFGQKAAVDNISIKFYQSEIFCLLGHNGAGKSTSINLLTGMLKPTSGQIQLMGLNYHDNLNQIRQNIGLCLQHNVLYDELTIQDHLRYYYQIKGLPIEKMEQDVNQTIQKCALGGQRGKLSKNLSGGNKRKLCLANSLIGGSKIVFLDEPSSGLDPNSRQAIWGIMKKLRQQNRCIILTTHHLQEAQQLAQKIGIMSEGKLIIVGDCNYVKEKFNVGYHLVITLKKNSEESRQKIRKIVKEIATNSQQDQQSASNTLKFILPMNQADKYSQLFSILEQSNLGQLSLKMSSLQDAFIKLGTQQMNADGNSNIPDLPDMQLPQVKCQYNFYSQFQAVFKKKAITIFRSFGAVVSVLLPIFFIVLGVIMAVYLVDAQNNDVNNYIKRFMISYFMVWAFVFNTSSYCGSIVFQRQKRFKYLSNVMGVRKMPYWMGNYALDLIIFFIPLLVFFAILFTAGQKANFLTDVAGYLMLSLLVFGFSFIGYSYLFSFVFQKSNTAYRFFPFFNLFFLYFIPQIPSFIEPKGILAQYVMPALSPFIAFSNNFFTKQILGPFSQYNYFKSQSYAFNIICMIVQAIIYLVATLYVQDLRFSLKGDKNANLVQQHQVNHDQFEFHEQIQPQRQSVESSKPIYIQNLTKVYPNGYRAIRNNSFSVKNGQIFGLLGPNGAGKSTTFNIATAALSKSSGTVKLFNQQVNKGISQIFQNVGVCPQYDAIYNQLTTEQHLEYFARIKGIPKQFIPSTIDFYCQLLSLKPFKKIKAGQLSGGNKRKLCVSMAMIGNPQVLFCDQPSSGVDPVSRRYLWKALALAAKTKNTSMVLTTHSMNQAQSLCSRIGILIKGKFVCVDTPKGLKNIYGEGFRVYITAEVERHQKLIDFVQKQIGKQVKHQIISSKPDQILFKIPIDKFVLSKIYYLFHNTLFLKKQISRYQIKESSLEQVFIHLSKMQPEVQEQKYQEPWQILCWEWGKNGCFRL